MKEITIGKNDAGQRLDSWMDKTHPRLPAPMTKKYNSIKRVKVNVICDTEGVCTGGVVQL